MNNYFIHGEANMCKQQNDSCYLGLEMKYDTMRFEKADMINEKLIKCCKNLH